MIVHFFTLHSFPARLQDPQGHLYTVRDLRLKFSEPASAESSSLRKMNELLDNSVRWSRKKLLDDSVGEAMVSIENVKVPGWS